MKHETSSLAFRQLSGRILLTVCDIFAAYPILHLLLRSVFGDRLGFISFMNNLIHWWLLLTLPLLVVMLMLRQWRRTAVAAVDAIAFVWLFGELFLPAISQPNTSLETQPPLVVMTYNAGNDQVTPDALVALVRDTGADIVGLQELSPAQVTAIETQLEDDYPYQALYGYGIHCGIGILSRHPILAEELLFLNWHTHPHQLATLSIDGIPLRMIVIHPPPPHYELDANGPYQSRGTDDLIMIIEIATADEPTIMLGDLNATDQSTDYALLQGAGFSDAFRAAGWGFGTTFPDRIGAYTLPAPLVRIDYIWHTEHFCATRAWVGPDAGSDHLPVLAELVLVQE
jgi:vancomycin resistance protein VanJ